LPRSDPTSGTPRLCSCLCLCLVGSALPEVCAANDAIAHPARSRVIINPQSIRLPIVDAADNRFVRLSTALGVSQLKADYILQDGEGFMWFGTRYGLYRYDGYSFKVFVHQPGNPKSLDTVTVGALFKDRDGALWVASAQSLNKFDRTTETFQRYPIPSASFITQDTAGMLWLPAVAYMAWIQRRGASSTTPTIRTIPQVPAATTSHTVVKIKAVRFGLRVMDTWMNSTAKQAR
jgi:ligand-binding sensor domain-containing protein